MKANYIWDAQSDIPSCSSAPKVKAQTGRAWSPMCTELSVKTLLIPFIQQQKELSD